MLTIDAQLHAYERNHPGRPWHAVLTGPPEVTGDQTVATLDTAGVDGAILISAFTMYRYDASYALEVYKRHPGRFAVVKPVDPANPAVADVIADWKRTEGAVGVRMLLVRGGYTEDPADPGLNRVLAEARRLSLPVNLHIAGRLDQGIELIRRNPDTQIIVDHLGLVQPHEPPVPAEPWADLPKVLMLAKLANVTMKITGACTLSREPFPFSDIWDPVCRLIDAFGIDRCLWGTDWTRAVKFLTFAQGVDAFRMTDRLSPTDKAKLMGGNVARVYGWSPRRSPKS
jgi:L-fuconolactonase